MTDFVIVLPAAGASCRMQGRDKLLEPVDGVALLRRQVMVALALNVPVAVTLDPMRTDRAAVLKGLEVTKLHVEHPSLGMSQSLKQASQWADTRGLMILLPDVPDLTATDLQNVVSRWDGKRPCRATDPSGKPGTPFLLPPALHTRFSQLTGDMGGWHLFQNDDVAFVSFPDRRATRDLDTPEDWDAWQKSRRS